MPFKKLINKSMSESLLLNLIAVEIQAHFFDCQSLYFFLKVNKSGDNFSEIVWIKTFDDAYALRDFFYDTVMDRACVMVKFEKGHYDVLFRGHYYSNRIEIWLDKVTDGYPVEWESDRESRPMLPFEFLEKAFGELKEMLIAAPDNQNPEKGH